MGSSGTKLDVEDIHLWVYTNNNNCDWSWVLNGDRLSLGEVPILYIRIVYPCVMMLKWAKGWAVSQTCQKLLVRVTYLPTQTMQVKPWINNNIYCKQGLGTHFSLWCLFSLFPCGYAEGLSVFSMHIHINENEDTTGEMLEVGGGILCLPLLTTNIINWIHLWVSTIAWPN